MKYSIITLILFSLLPLQKVEAQSEQGWSLTDCINFAHENSIEVKQTILQTESSRVSLKQAQVSMTPSVNAKVGQNFSFGRATGIDNIIVDNSQASTSFSAAASMPLFDGLRIVHSIKKAKVDLAASLADVEGSKESITLNVTAVYLQVLFNKELMSIAKEQHEQANLLTEDTRILVDKGRKSESELYENMAQLAQYQQQYTEAENAFALSKLDLCQLINYPDVKLFTLKDVSAEIDALSKDELPLTSPSEAYSYSLENRPALKAQNLRLESARRDVKIAQADYYPSLDLSASYGTGYYHVYNMNNPAFGQQFKLNGSTVVGFNLSVPIYNRLNVRSNVKHRKIAMLSKELDIQNVQMNLRKDIENAYYNALAAQKKLSAAQHSTKASKIAFDFEGSKYLNGSSTALNYAQTQTRWRKAQTEESQAKYELILRTKILNFYIGVPITL